MWNYPAKPFPRGRAYRLALALAHFAALVATMPAHADDSAPLTQLSIEDLMDIDVSLVSRRPEPRSNAAAAVYVITREEIERSPALAVPELLRYVPGVNVARIDASKWSITIRGFSGQIANKLQVLIDGRSIFTAVFSGVPWEDHFMPLELIERIEVIRGPGGATWGANAVNGIINIITRDAAAHLGNQLTLSAGTELESAATFIHGGKLRGDTHYRAYLHQIGVRNSADVDGGPAKDNWRGLMGGLRWDGAYGDDALMFQLDGMVDRLYETYEAPLSPRYPDGFLDSVARTQRVVTLGRWTRSLSETSEFQIQASYQHYEYESILLGEWRNIGNLDFQHRFEAGARHEVMWGLSAAYYEDHETATEHAALYPARRRQRLFSAFAQDQIRWRDGAVALTLGARLEYTDQDDVNLLPSARLAWTIE